MKAICRSRKDWPQRPRQEKHPMLIRRQVWLRNDGLARVDRFMGGSRRFIAMLFDEEIEAFHIIGNFATLARAQSACDRKQTTGN